MRTVRPALRIVPAAGGIYVVTEDHAVARISLPGGRLLDPIPGTGDAIDAGWTPRAVLDEASVVFTRHLEVAILRSWDGRLEVVAEGARLLGARHSQVLTASLDAESRTPVLATHALTYTSGGLTDTVSNTVPLPADWLLVQEPAGFTDQPGAVVYVQRGGVRALAIVGPYGDEVSLVPGSLGADPSAGITRGFDTVIFGVTSNAGTRYASWEPDTPETPARLTKQPAPRGFRLAAARSCFPGGLRPAAVACPPRSKNPPGSY